MKPSSPKNPVEEHLELASPVSRHQEEPRASSGEALVIYDADVIAAGERFVAEVLTTSRAPILSIEGTKEPHAGASHVPRAVECIVDDALKNAIKEVIRPGLQRILGDIVQEREAAIQEVVKEKDVVTLAKEVAIREKEAALERIKALEESVLHHKNKVKVTSLAARRAKDAEEKAAQEAEAA